MAAFTTIDDAGSFFNTLLWTGDDTARTLTGVGFQPDFTWIKNREGAYNHVWWDAPRGAGSTTDIACNTVE